jgi:hypothetical protein
MARNTIVAIMLGVSATLLTVMAVLGIIEGDVYATALTGITSLGTVLIGVFSQDNKNQDK